MTKRTRCSVLVALGLVALGLGATATAATNRRLLGRVVDAAGTPIAGVTVTLVNVGGPPPEMKQDRSAINSAGTGRSAYATHNALPWQAGPAAGVADAKQEPLKILRTDENGEFNFSTHEYVAAVAVNLEQAGFAATTASLGLPLGVTRQDFVLRPPPTSEVTAGAASEAEAAFTSGLAQVEQKNWVAARDAFARVVELTPTAHQAWLNLAIAQVQLTEFEAALASARRVIALAPEVTIAKSIEADALARLGETKVAGADPASAAKVDPPVAARLAYNDGAALLKSGDVVTATARFTEALAKDPTLVDAHFALGMIHASLGDNVAARAQLTRLLELAPGHPKGPRAKQLLGDLGQ